MMDIEFVRSRFIKHFDGKTGNVYASPGRINLIGEHTDYNGGFVFPGAVDKGIIAEMRPNDTEDTVMAYAIDLKDRVDFRLNDPEGPKAYKGRALQNLINIESDDSVRAVINVKNLNEADYINNHYVVLCTANGIIKKTFAMGYGSRWSGHRAQLLRCKLRYHGPVCLSIWQGRLPDAPRLPQP